MSQQCPSEHDRLIDEVRAAGEMVAKFFVHEQLGPILGSTLTMQQLKLVALLATHGPLGGHDLARHLDVSMPTVSGIVDRLVERGMVERRADPRDRRVRLTALSPAGEAFIAEHDAAGWRVGMEILHAMAPEDLRALARGLAAMWAAVEAKVASEGGCLPDGCAGGPRTAP
ncbi:DNA-binding transcriptional regulator, MarR family [Georgenia satyanarayanai]|uniref:DNA-binding transcriptional regulator, MarR family n=1 Tax=Georgenia satyanarayanai TaxID=860221 RepID=A0A2Y9A3Q9_9MICO|nr:MarR family transcriptional regulator [Georgenia satyanarayanai]PYG00882.1 DNA-binding MarR family transcriptional regulator [Georgenia satyanarayanai]SSA39121.1 DNA-binding transcriptional regulator, MarR family [Georgenia satyanarayanai]